MMKGVFEFWVDSNKPRAKDLQKGMQLRLLTIGTDSAPSLFSSIRLLLKVQTGESVFADSFQFLNAKTNLFKGMAPASSTLL